VHAGEVLVPQSLLLPPRTQQAHRTPLGCPSQGTLWGELAHPGGRGTHSPTTEHSDSVLIFDNGRGLAGVRGADSLVWERANDSSKPISAALAAGAPSGPLANSADQNNSSFTLIPFDFNSDWPLFLPQSRP
jgi:hypothetical protein